MKQRETERQQALFVEKRLAHRERDRQREEQGLEEGVADWGPRQHYGRCSVGLPPCLDVDVQDIQAKPGEPPTTQASREDHRSVIGWRFALGPPCVHRHLNRSGRIVGSGIVSICVL